MHVVRNTQIHIWFSSFTPEPSWVFGLCGLCRLCTTTPEVKLQPTTLTVMNLGLKLDFIKVQYLVLSYSSLCSKLCHVSSALGHELLYADDLVIIAETEDELKMKLIKRKTNLEAKGLRVSMGKTKIMVSGVDLQMLKDSGKYPCSVCRKVLRSNSIYCTGCLQWVQKKCNANVMYWQVKTEPWLPL